MQPLENTPYHAFAVTHTVTKTYIPKETKLIIAALALFIIGALALTLGIVGLTVPPVGLALGLTGVALMAVAGTVIAIGGACWISTAICTIVAIKKSVDASHAFLDDQAFTNDPYEYAAV